MTFGHVLGTERYRGLNVRLPAGAAICALTRAKYSGAGDENRTRMTSLEGWGSAIELHPRSVMILNA